MGMLRRFNRDEHGASAVEYIVALILCCMVVMGINKLFGETLRAKFQASQNEISEMDSAEEQGSDGKTGRSLGAKAAAGGTVPSKKGQGGRGSDGSGSGSGGEAGGRSGGASASGGPGSGGGAGGSGGGVRGARGKDGQGGAGNDPGGYVEGFEEEKKAGFNPLFLLIFLGLGGMLIFIMYKGNRG